MTNCRFIVLDVRLGCYKAGAFNRVETFMIGSSQQITKSKPYMIPRLDAQLKIDKVAHKVASQKREFTLDFITFEGVLTLDALFK